MLLDTDISYYGLRISDYGNSRDDTGVMRTEIVLQNANSTTPILAEELARDMELMSKIRSSNDPSVRDAFEGMLTLMALANGRNYNKTVAEERAMKAST